MSLKNIFSFLSRGEHSIIERVVALLDVSIDSANHLVVLSESLRAHDYEAVDREFETIHALERKVDEDHRQLVREIATGSFFGGIREDLLDLLELIDNIADSAKNSAQIFHQIRFPDEVIDYLFQGDVGSFIKSVIDAAETFKQAIRSLEKDKDEVLSLTEKVEKDERQSDELHHKIVQHLFKNEINAKSLDIIMLRDFLSLVDDIADNSEGGSDVLQVLVAKGYS